MQDNQYADCILCVIIADMEHERLYNIAVYSSIIMGVLLSFHIIFFQENAYTSVEFTPNEELNLPKDNPVTNSTIIEKNFAWFLEQCSVKLGKTREFEPDCSKLIAEANYFYVPMLCIRKDPSRRFENMWYVLTSDTDFAPKGTKLAFGKVEKYAIRSGNIPGITNAIILDMYFGGTAETPEKIIVQEDQWKCSRSIQ